jgi:hypothetical protein
MISSKLWDSKAKHNIIFLSTFGFLYLSLSQHKRNYYADLISNYGDSNHITK